MGSNQLFSRIHDKSFTTVKWPQESISHYLHGREAVHEGDIKVPIFLEGFYIDHIPKVHVQSIVNAWASRIHFPTPY